VVPDDGSTAAVIAELRRGPRTTGELVEATGMSRNAVACAIRRANEVGYVIVHGRPGDRRGGVYRILLDACDPGDRYCAVPWCGRLLSDTNLTPYCRYHLPLEAFRAQLELDLATSEPVNVDQLALLKVG